LLCQNGKIKRIRKGKPSYSATRHKYLNINIHKCIMGDMSEPNQNTQNTPIQKDVVPRKIIVGFKVDEELYYEFKIKAIRERKTASQVIEELMRKYVAGEVDVP
jgi:hypothetical protein